MPDPEALWGLILRIRQELDLGVNVRPARLLQGVRCPLADRGPDDIDMVFVRENTEGEYSGVGGRLTAGAPARSRSTRPSSPALAVERVIRYAFRVAQARDRVLVNATKSNASRYAFPFWDDVVDPRGAGLCRRPG